MWIILGYPSTQALCFQFTEVPNPFFLSEVLYKYPHGNLWRSAMPHVQVQYSSHTISNQELHSMNQADGILGQRSQHPLVEYHRISHIMKRELLPSPRRQTHETGSSDQKLGSLTVDG